MANPLKHSENLDGQIIAKNISNLMKVNKISESKLARELGVSVMTIRRVVSGETEDPRISTISLIADYFKISVDSLREENTISMTFMKNTKTIFVPILEWDTLEIMAKNSQIDLSTWKNWYPIINSDSLKLTNSAFALESKLSMQPRFPKGSLLIINPEEPILDNDTVLIKILNTNEFSLRELIIDSPRWILQPIIPGSEILFYSKTEHDIIGVVVLTVLHKRN